MFELKLSQRGCGGRAFLPPTSIQPTFQINFIEGFCQICSCYYLIDKSNFPYKMVDFDFGATKSLRFQFKSMLLTCLINVRF